MQISLAPLLTHPETSRTDARTATRNVSGQSLSHYVGGYTGAVVFLLIIDISSSPDVQTDYARHVHGRRFLRSPWRNVTIRAALVSMAWY